jgi:transcriptional regulator with XRE-family HTH domain
MKLTEKLDKLMKERGMTKADLARESGIPYTTIVSLYDKGYENVKLSTLKKLADYFGCSLDYIADDSVDEINFKKPTTIAAHIPDGVELTEEDMKQINDFIQFIISKKKDQK